MNGAVDADSVGERGRDGSSGGPGAGLQAIPANGSVAVSPRGGGGADSGKTQLAATWVWLGGGALVTALFLCRSGRVIARRCCRRRGRRPSNAREMDDDL